MATTNQIVAYVARTFPGLRVQTSTHSASQGSVQVFSAEPGMICDINTRRFGPGIYEITLTEIGRTVRNRLTEATINQSERDRRRLEKLTERAAP